MIAHLQLFYQFTIPLIDKLHVRINLEAKVLFSKEVLDAAPSIVSVASFRMWYLLYCEQVTLKLLKSLIRLLVRFTLKIMLEEDMDVESLLILSVID